MFIPRQKKYRKDIQVLRGLAVIAVILFHAKESYFPLGYLGVDVFFVISGFVVTPLILRIFTEQEKTGNRLVKLKYFYRRRFYRLAPALASTLIFSAIIVFLFGPVSDHQRFAKQGIASLLLAGNIGAYNYSGDYFNSSPNPLVHTWSLSVEEQIYIFLPLACMLILLNRKSIKKSMSVALTFITAASLMFFTLPQIMLPVYSKMSIGYETKLFDFNFYSPLSRIWQFTLGGLCFFLLDRYRNQVYEFKKLPSLIFVIILALILFGKFHLENRYGSIIASLIATVVIVLRSLEIVPIFISSKLEWLGDRSYSIYLVHMPLIYIAKYALATSIGDGQTRTIQTIIAVVASVIFGSISYSKIENRFREQNKKKILSTKDVSFTLLLTLMLPLSLFMTIDKGVDYKYWGLNVKYPKVPIATDLISGCDNDLVLNEFICTNTKSGAIKTVLLIGDSHAGHISLALEDAAKINNWNSVYFPKKVETFDHSTNVKLANFLLRKKIDLIVISQYWNSNSQPAAIKKQILYLQGLVPNILLIENNPIWPDSARFRLAGYVITFNKFPTSFQKSKMEIKDKDVSDQIAEWARYNRISTMNFESLFCTSNVCSRYSEAGWLYVDNNHFSIPGGELTIPQLSKFLKSF